MKIYKKRQCKVKSIATYEEWEFCSKLIKDNFFKYSYFNPYELNDIKGLFVENILIGTFTLKEINNNSIYINYFIIEEKSRKKGLGHIFIKKIIRYLKYKKYKKIKIHSTPELEQFYLKYNFKIIKETNNYKIMELKI